MLHKIWRCPFFTNTIFELQILINVLLFYRLSHGSSSEVSKNSQNEVTTTPESTPVTQTLLYDLYPKIPDGNKEYQFYTLNSKGELQKQLMTLQQVQVMWVQLPN